MRKSKIIVAVIAVGVALRVGFALAQLPYHFQADEFQIVERALRVGTGGWKPGLYTWPGTPAIYITFALFGAYYAVAKVVGLVTSAADFAALFWSGGGGFYLLARLLSVFWGTALVVAAWRLAERAAGPVAALVTAGFVTLAPAALSASSVALPDAGAAALGAVSLALTSSFIANRKKKYAVAAGAVLGCAAAFKYHILLYAPAIAVALFYACPRARRGRALLATAGAAVGAFVVSCPFVILDGPNFWRDVIGLFQRPGMVKFAPSAAYLWEISAPLTTGWPLATLAAVGVVAAARRRNAHAGLALGAVAPFVIAAALRPLPPRHLLPAIAPFGVCAGLIAVDCANAKHKLVKISLTLLVTLSFFGAAVLNIRALMWSWRPDTRVRATNFILNHLSPTIPLLVEHVEPDVEGPPVWPDKFTLYRLAKYYRDRGRGSPGRYEYFLKNAVYPFGKETRCLYLVEEFEDLKQVPRPIYAVRVKHDDASFFGEQTKLPGTLLAPWEGRYETFLKRSGARAIKSFRGDDCPGPTVTIYYLQ